MEALPLVREVRRLWQKSGGDMTRIDSAFDKLDTLDKLPRKADARAEPGSDLPATAEPPLGGEDLPKSVS